MNESPWILCNRQNQETIISSSVFRVGRSNNLEMPCISNKVSRDHAVFIIYPNETLHIRDNQSVNGTYINCKRIDPNRLHQLHVNDEVGIGLHSQIPSIETFDPTDVNYIFTIKKRLPNTVIVLDDGVEDAQVGCCNGVVDSPLTKDRLIDILGSDDEDNPNQNVKIATNLKEKNNQNLSDKIGTGEDEPSKLPVNHFQNNLAAKKDQPSTSACSINYLSNNSSYEPQRRDSHKPQRQDNGKQSISTSTCEPQRERTNSTDEPKKVEKRKPSICKSSESTSTHQPQTEKNNKPPPSNCLHTNSTKKSQNEVKDEQSTNPQSTKKSSRKEKNFKPQRKEPDKLLVASSSSKNCLPINSTKELPRKRDNRSTSSSSGKHLKTSSLHEPQRKDPDKSDHVQTDSTREPIIKERDKSTNHVRISPSHEPQRKDPDKSDHVQTDSTREPFIKKRDKRSISSSTNHVTISPSCEPQRKDPDKSDHAQTDSTREPFIKKRDKRSISSSSTVYHFKTSPQREETDEPLTSPISKFHLQINSIKELPEKEKDKLLNPSSSYVLLKKELEKPLISVSSKVDLQSNSIKEPSIKKRDKRPISSSENHFITSPGHEPLKKEIDEPLSSASAVNHIESIPEEENKIKQEPSDVPYNHHRHNNYTMEDGCIIIDDDDDEFPCSQLLDDGPTSNHVNEDFFNESIFCTIKKELEGLDKPEDGRVYACVDLAQSEDENDNQDWLLDDDNSNEKKDEVTETVPQLDIQEKDNNEPSKPQRSSTNKYSLPPVIAPHFETKIKPRRNTDNKKPEKRKIVENNNDDQIKKIKTNTFYDTKNKKVNGWKRKRRESVSKEAKEEIHEIRKKKLKEIAEKKSEETEKEVAKSKIATAKVKISDSRGKFLALDMPSTSKATHTAVKPPVRTRAVSIDTKKPGNSKAIPNSCASNKPQRTNAVHNNNNNQIYPTPLLPQSVIPVQSIPRIPRNCEGIGDILIRFLNWKSVWFIRWKDNKIPPPLHDQPLARMSQNFSSYTNYYKIVMPLLELELWNYVVKGLYEDNEPRKKKFLAEIRNETKMHNYTELQCYTHITKEQSDTNCHLKEEDAVLVQFAFRQSDPHKITIPLVGYVTEVSKRILKDKDFINEDFGVALGINPHAKIAFKVLVQSYNGIVEKDTYMRVKIMVSLVPSTRIIRSVKYLENSVLCQHVLKPTLALYAIPRIHREKLLCHDQLNATQYQAVVEATDMCLRKEPGIYLIQGPPGTGKSTVIINIIQQILFRELNANSSKKCCILVVAPSNAAVDELTKRLVSLKTKLEASERKEIKLVRLGPNKMISPAVQDYSLYEMAKRNVIDTYVKSQKNAMISNKLQTLQQKIGSCQGDVLKYKAAKLELERTCQRMMGRGWADDFRKTENTLLEKARIICTTLSSCVGQRMQEVFGGRSQKIQCCIVDEATQSSEQETLIPLMLGINKMVLVGDPKQLPAVTLSKEAKDCAYGQSLFSRILSNFERKANNPIKMLDTQYRMNPAICEFPNKAYYDGNLKCAPMLRNRPSKLTILKPYLVLNFKVDHCSSQEYSNQAEINCVIKLLDAIALNIKDSCVCSIGIITPYNSQKEGIQANIIRKTFGKKMSIAVNTVDSFQGQEKDIMIMSCVRDYSNSFINDEQRLNVAMTRAVDALYIIGSDSLFKSCVSLGKVYDDAKNRYLIQIVNSKTTVYNLSNMIRRR